MRLNRGTVILIVALLVAIVVIMVVNTNQMSAPGVTPTAAAASVSGALLPNVPAESIVHYEIRDNNTGQFTALTKDASGAWQIDGTNAQEGKDPAQDLISTTAGQISSINYSNTFESDGSDLATFGLDHPLYSVLVLTDDGTLYTVYIGSKSPTSGRYYATVASQTGQAAPTDEPSAAATEAISDENFVEPTEDATVEAAAAAMSEATAESTSAAGSPKRIARQATEEPTDEVTPDPSAEAVSDVSAQADNGGAVSVEPAPTVEATVDLSAVTPEATTEATAEVTLEATADLIGSPQVTLSGAQTVYLIPQTVIDTLKNWLNTPPYAPPPTAAPTSEALIPEATVESTAEAVGVQGTIQPTIVLAEGADPNLIPEGTPFATLSSTAEVTAEPTAEATAAP